MQVFKTPSSTNSINPGPPQGRLRAKARSKKVALAPGHSPLDWARLKRSDVDLRQVSVPYLLKVTPEMLGEHNSRNNAWTAISGKVYNLTAYLPFHPGGEEELMRGAGKDSTKLFQEIHPWVNVENMLDAAFIGIISGQTTIAE